MPHAFTHAAAFRFTFIPCALACAIVVRRFDASRFGNLSSWIRDTCTGNLTPVLLYTSASRLPRILLLAARDIVRGEELTLQHDPLDCAQHSVALHRHAVVNVYSA